MTQQELKAEFDYRYSERIAILCVTEQPTDSQVDIAFNEACEAVKQLSPAN